MAERTAGRVGRIRAIGAGILLVLAAGAFEPFFLRVYTADRGALARHLVELPYRKLPTLRTFLDEAAPHVTRGDRVLFLAPFPRFEQGYRYAFGRAAFALARARVIPFVGRDDRPIAANLERADAVVAWRTAPPPGFEVVWEHPEGVVARRRR